MSERPLAITRLRSTRTGPSKSKSVTFTGCWTCRSRKVKCDERQRGGCRVCEKAGLRCAGYAVNLSWVTDEKQHLQGLRRRTISADHVALPSLSDHAITKTLLAIDSVSASLDTVVMGPFGIFQIGSTNATEGNPDLSVVDVDRCEPESSIIEAHGNVWEDDGAFADFNSLDPPAPDDREISGILPGDEPQQWGSLPHDIDTPSITYSSDSLSEMIPLSTSPPQRLATPYLGLSAPIFTDHQTSRLMYHYMNNVAELLQPILHPRNPWRTTYFPSALSGRPELVLYQHNGTTSSSISTSLFHSLLSAAAFHLRNLTDGSVEFHQLGLKHRIKALNALNSATVDRNDPQLYSLFLTAMLSLVTIDTMTGEDSDFPIHLNACRQLRKPTQSSSMAEDSGSQLDSIRRFLTLLARTTAREIDARPWPLDDSLAFDLPHFSSDERSIEYIYGITPALGNLLQKSCQVSEYLRFYQQQKRPMPLSLQQACAAIYDEITAWAIDLEPFHLIPKQERTMLEIARCQARAFHGALLIYHRRVVLEEGGIEYAVDVQTEIQAILENLTAAEDLKDAYMGGEKRTAPMSWPAFIAACEALDRQPWSVWWSRVQGYHLGNFSRQWRVIQEVWSVVDADGRVSGWREALWRIGKPVLPV